MLRQFVNRRIVPLFHCVETMLGTVAFLTDDVGAPASIDKRGCLYVNNITDSDIRDGITAFDIFSTPAAATQATATAAAPGNGKRNLLTSLTATVSAAAAAQPILTLVVRDGASGVGAIRWSAFIGPVLNGDSKTVTFDNLNIAASNNTALTVEFTAAPAGGNFESVAATGRILGGN